MFHLHSSWLAAVHPPRHWLHRATRTAAATANADVGVRRPCLSQLCPKKWRSWWTSLGESTWINYGLWVNISNYFMGFLNFELGEKTAPCSRSVSPKLLVDTWPIRGNGCWWKRHHYPLVTYGKIHHFLMGKSTIYMAMFNSYVCLPEGNYQIWGSSMFRRVPDGSRWRMSLLMISEC